MKPNLLHTASRNRLLQTIFVLLIGIFVTGVVILCNRLRMNLGANEDRSFEVREFPLRLRNNVRQTIPLPKERLEPVFAEVLQHDYSRWNQLIHGLRLWGCEGNDNHKWSGKSMLATVCSAELSIRTLGYSPHLMNRNGLMFGYELDSQLVDRGEKHLDETLSVLGEIGVSSRHPIQLANHQVEVREVIRATISNFLIDQSLEFTAVALSHYLPPQRRWTNKFGETFDFDDLCEQLMQMPRDKSSCYGCHVMFALATILLADEQHEILSSSARGSTRKFLKHATETLRETQRQEGTWDQYWDQPKQPAFDRDFAVSLAVTGHTLEWLALAPQEFVDEEMVETGCQSLASLMWSVPSGTSRDHYNAYTHAVSALRLWSPATNP